MEEPDTAAVAAEEQEKQQQEALLEPAELPGAIVRKIAALVLQLEPNPANKMLAAVAMAGVNQHWRQSAPSCVAGNSVAFDGTEAMAPSPGGLMARFRRAESAKKTGTFEAAARLLQGEECREREGRKEEAVFLQRATSSSLVSTAWPVCVSPLLRLKCW